MGLDASEAQIQALCVQLHLTDSLPVQFWHYVQDLTHLDLGQSLVSQQPVTDTLRNRLPNSLKLATLAILFVAVVSVPLGTMVAALTSFGARRPVQQDERRSQVEAPPATEPASASGTTTPGA